MDRDAPSVREQLLAGTDLATITLGALCRRCSAFLDGAGVDLRLEADDQVAVAEASDPETNRVAATQATLGQGPTIDALRRHRTVLTADVGADLRWPELGGALSGPGRGVVAVPLAIDGVQIGALTVLLGRSGTIDGVRVTRIMHLATVVTGIVLSLPIGGKLDDGLATTISTAVAGQAQIHQAAGVVSVHEACSLAEALLKLRAHAYASEQLLSEVARAVIDDGLRLR